jgi:hypothetical protein
MLRRVFLGFISTGAGVVKIERLGLFRKYYKGKDFEIQYHRVAQREYRELHREFALNYSSV